MYTRKTLFKKKFAISVALASIVAVIFTAIPGLAYGATYTNVNKDGWNFTYSEQKNIIIARSDTRIAIYKNESANRWSQTVDYYNQGGETFQCGSHIDKTTLGGPGSGPRGVDQAETTGYTLYEADKGGCQNDQYHQNGIQVGTSNLEDLKAASKINYGADPVACKPGGTDPSGASYPCPNNKDGVIDGKFKKGKADEALQKAAANAEKDSKTPVQDPGATCDDNAGALGWIICPVANLVDDTASKFEDVLQNLLRINNVSSSSGLYVGWKNIKNVASIIIVLFALIIVASQIFGFEFLSAYTVKKAIPRLVIAVIALQLSWFLATTLVVIMNAVGDGIQALLLMPFPDLAKAINSGDAIKFIIDTYGKSNNNGAAISYGGIVLAIMGTIGFAAAGGVGALISAVVIVAFAVLIGFITLVLRVVMVWGLIVIMPLAIVMWVLPGTQRYWDQWWGTFWKLLFMYPLIIGLLTIGKIGAYLAANTTANGQLQAMAHSDHFASIPNMLTFFGASGPVAIVTFLIIIIAYFGPYYFLPSSFKFGGTLFAKAAGAMQGIGNKWGKQAGGVAQQSVNKTAGRLARNHNNMFTRGLNYGAHGALTKGGRVRAASQARKAFEESSQEYSALMEQKTNGMGHQEKVNYYAQRANKGNDIESEVAIEKLYGMNEAGEVRNQVKQSKLHRIARRNDKIAGDTWTKLRDYAEGGQGTVASMSAQQLAGQDDSVWKAIAKQEAEGGGVQSWITQSAGQSDAEFANAKTNAARNFSSQIQNIKQTPTLQAAMKSNGQAFLNSYASGGGGPTTSGGGGGPTTGGGGGGPTTGGGGNHPLHSPGGTFGNASSIISNLEQLSATGRAEQGFHNMTDKQVEDAFVHARDNKWHEDRGGTTTKKESEAMGLLYNEMQRRGRIP